MLGVYYTVVIHTGPNDIIDERKPKTSQRTRTSERINKPIAPPKYTVVRQQIAIDFGNASALWIQLDIAARVCIFSYPSGCARKGKIFAFRLKVISARDCTSGHNTATFFSSHSAIRRWYCTFGGPKTKQNPRLGPFSKRLRGAYAMMMTFGYAHNDNLNTRNSICIQVHCFRRTHTFAGLLLLLSPIKVPRIANYLNTTVFLQVVAPFLWLARCCFFFRHNYNVKRRHLHSALYRGLCKFTSNAKRRVMIILWVSHPHQVITHNNRENGTIPRIFQSYTIYA